MLIQHVTIILITSVSAQKGHSFELKRRNVKATLSYAFASFLICLVSFH